MFRVILCIFLSSLQLLFSFDGWIHLELGGGNYGGNSCNQQKFDPKIQYKLLFWTLDQLIERHGPDGVFQVNDIKQSYTEYACQKLQDYADTQGYDRLIIEECPGNYFTTDFLPYLEKYERKKYNSLHLKNPDSSIYRDHRQQTRQNLQKLANYSEEGLHFFTLYQISFFPESEKKEFVEQGIFYLETDQWEAVDYYYQNGNTIRGGRVFQILPDENS